MSEVLNALIIASERSANIARSCCAVFGEGNLLIAEKCEGEANARFDKDFKTIADVLAQECAKAELLKRCPGLLNNIRGEECSEINGVQISLKDTVEETQEILNLLMPFSASKVIAEAALKCATPSIDIILPGNLPELESSELGVWIDPIDATAEFISGVCGEADEDHGLSCVTVLVGAYMRSTGEPVLGVINQPFYNNGKGRILWGASYSCCNEYGSNEPQTVSDVSNAVLMSSAEKDEIKEKFKEEGWEIKSYPGAGNKLMKVALGEANAYIVSQGSTFRWDTCAPHAILRSKGGDVVSYKTMKPVTYNIPDGLPTQQYANSEGIIAYSNPSVFLDIKKIIN